MKTAILCLPLLLLPLTAPAQMPLSPGKAAPANPLTQPTIAPGDLTLMELDGRFNEAVKKGGGKAFAEWFAPNAVTLNNKQAPVRGKTAIAAQATWTPAEYQLSWYALGASMGPSNDLGYTWGHYEGHSKDHNGQPVVISGRYITLWQKMPNGDWKVVMDASAEEPPNASDCCALPKP